MGVGSKAEGQDQLVRPRVACSKAGCGKKVSYANKMILIHLLWGQKSREFREKVLQRGDRVTLEEVLVQLESLERGKAENAKLGTAAGFGLLWEQRRALGLVSRAAARPTEVPSHGEKTDNVSSSM